MTASRVRPASRERRAPVAGRDKDMRDGRVGTITAPVGTTTVARDAMTTARVARVAAVAGAAFSRGPVVVVPVAEAARAVSAKSR